MICTSFSLALWGFSVILLSLHIMLPGSQALNGLSALPNDICASGANCRSRQWGHCEVLRTYYKLQYAAVVLCVLYNQPKLLLLLLLRLRRATALHIAHTTRMQRTLNWQLLLTDWILIVAWHFCINFRSNNAKHLNGNYVDNLSSARPPATLGPTPAPSQTTATSLVVCNFILPHW